MQEPEGVDAGRCGDVWASTCAEAEPGRPALALLSYTKPLSPVL